MKKNSKRYKALLKVSGDTKTKELKDVFDSVKKHQPPNLMSLLMFH